MDNGLRPDIIKSKIVGGEITDLRNYNQMLDLVHSSFGQKGYLVAYLDYKVHIGKFDGETFALYDEDDINPKYLQRLRVFNGVGEFYLWRSAPYNYRYRLRWDEDGESTHIVRSCQTLWGTKSESRGPEWTRLYEDRGTEVLLPIGGLILNNRGKNKEEDRVSIDTINYIGANSLGQAGYVDSRLVGFSRGGKRIG